MIKTKIIVKPKDGSSSSGSVTEGSYGSGYADYAASAGRAKQSDRSALATLAETAISAYRAKRADMASELDPDSETLQGYVLKEWLGKLLTVVDGDGTEQDINGTVGDGMKIMPHLDLTSIDVSGDGHISLGGMQMVYDAEHGAWRLDGSLYVTGGLSALGNSDVAGGGGGGLDAELLWSLLSNNGTEQISKSHLADALAGYATEEWVEGKGYLTNRDVYTKEEIDAKDWSSNKGTVTSVGITMPTGFSVSGSPITEKGILAVGFASGYSLPTTAKQSNWDTVYNWYSGITGSDTDTIINKWGEIISFLDGIEDTETLSGIVNGINQSITAEANRAKAEERSLSKSITDEVSRAKAAEQTLTSSISTNTSAINVLKGYFTNGVAKSAVKLQTARKIWGNTFDGTQDVAGDLILPNGKKIVIGGASLSWDADNKSVKIDGSVYATGGLSALGNSDTTGGGGGLMGCIVPYAKAIALTVQNEGEEIASAWSVKMLYDKIENVDVSGQLTSYLTKQEAQSLYQPVGNYLTAHQSLDGYVNGIAVEGTGNAVTTVAKSGKTVIFTKGANYLTGITKAQVEGVLTGNITTHTHSQYLTAHQDISGKADRSELLGYLPLTGGTLTGNLNLGRNTLFAQNLSLNSESDDWNFKLGDRRIRLLNTSTASAAIGAPVSYTSGVSFITGYVGFQLVSDGRSNDDLYFRKLQGTNVWNSWYKIYHEGFKPTKSDVGLGNVDNTADANKSVNYATTSGVANSVAWGNVSGRPTSMPASDVYAWAKAATKPNYTYDEIKVKSLVNVADFTRVVIALCEVSKSQAYTGEFSSGEILYYRSNGIIPIEYARVNFIDSYNLNYDASYSLETSTENESKDKPITGIYDSVGFRKCTFVYNGKHYAGVEAYFSQAASYYWRGYSHGHTVFGVIVEQNKAVMNEEIYNSLSYDGQNRSGISFGNVIANSFAKKDSSDSYVLLGGGGHALISSLSVATATKLQTARTIWGQRFDGTSNVDGNLSCNGQGSFNSLQIGNITISYDEANKGLRIAGGGLYTDSYLSSLGVDASTALSVKKWADSIQITTESDAELATAYSIGNLYRMINSNQKSITESLNQSVSALQGRCTSLENRVLALENKVNK